MQNQNMENQNIQNQNMENQNMQNKKYCKHCGKEIDSDCIICPICGKQVEELVSQQPSVIINNENTNTNVNQNTNMGGPMKPPRDKVIALLLCFFLGVFGAHKFYEGKTGMGILYLFTGGLCGFGALVDFIVLIFKPNPYYV